MSLDEALKKAIDDAMKPLIEKLDALVKKTEPGLIPANDLAMHRPGFRWNTERQMPDMKTAITKQHGRNFIDLKLFDEIVLARAKKIRPEIFPAGMGVRPLKHRK